MPLLGNDIFVVEHMPGFYAAKNNNLHTVTQLLDKLATANKQHARN